MAPILEEVAVSLQDDEDVVIAKMVVHFSVDYSKIIIATDLNHRSVVEYLLRHYKRLIPLVLQDGTANDIPTDFAVDGYPALYFYSSSGGDLLTYDGPRTAAEIISFIKKNRGAKAAAVDVTQTDAVEEEVTSSTPSGSVQDEL